MRCPNDDTTLAITDRQGIEIDYCPTCRGVWLDRGELDKLIERAAGGGAGRRPERRDDRRDDGRWDDDDGRPAKRKRESFLSDLFEFGG
jgi:Zn-finger nucleic acid-binding protein